MLMPEDQHMLFTGLPLTRLTCLCNLCLTACSKSQAVVCRALQVKTHAKHVLVIEKEAVFRSLADAAIWSQLPVILVTASGMPDLASRAFLRHLADALPDQLTFMGLVDWNPSGCHILMTYKFGNPKRSSESVECAAALACVE
jgi:DNA topoisomerase VI subunit A